MFISNFGGGSKYKDGGGDSLPKMQAGTSVLDQGNMVPGSGTYQPSSITVYPINAASDAPPLRTIQGPNTQLNWPAQIYVDDQHGEVYVSNDGDNSIVVFRVTDNGNVAPSRVLKGSKTQIQNPTGVSLDTINDELFVANMGNHKVTVYPRTAQGNTPPVRVIRAGPEGTPALMIGNPGAVAYDTKRDEILVPN